MTLQHLASPLGAPASGAPEPARAFGAAPQSLQALVAALLEPVLWVATWVGVHELWQQPFSQPSMVVMLLAVTTTFPGSASFTDRPSKAAAKIAGGWFWLVGLMVMFAFATSNLDLFPRAMTLTCLLATPLLQWCLLVVGRRWVIAQERARARPCSVVIVGGNALGVRAGQALLRRSDGQTEILGYFDDRGADRLHNEAGEHRLGNLSGVADFVNQRSVDEVYITLPSGSQPRVAQVLESLQQTTASIHFVPDVVGISVIQGRLRDVGGVPMVGLCESPFTGVNAALKRLSDIVLASSFLVLLCPLMVAVAVGVRLSSPGPVIFRQRRNGLGGAEIIVYKFRSMRALDNGPVVRQATRDDDRITPFGRFIRKTSLDELPQFINVLQGRMSVVGPRPHAVAHNNAYQTVVRAYMVRHKVRPGITGWAQVNGCRGETETLDKMQARIEFDLDYLRNWSLSLDLEIILRTARLVLFDRSAH